jgi:type IV secretion system protein VirB9
VKIQLAVSLFALAILPAPAMELAQRDADPRIQSIAYDPNQVVQLKGTLGYQFMLEFSPNEKIETVSIGDSLAWQITPNRKADVLFIKPVIRSATNLTVLTNQRRYAFDLKVAPTGGSDPILYVARLTYPEPAEAMAVDGPTAPPPAIAPEIPHRAATSSYAFKGAAALFPDDVFDDGRMTYFQLAPDAPVPAIFAVAPDSRNESLVNYFVRGHFLVIDQVAPEFKLRIGKDVATIQNRAWSTASKGSTFR